MITITYKYTRPDTSVPFFIDSPDFAELVTRWTELSDALDVKPVRTISEDQLESVTTFVFENQELSAMYQFVVDENLPEWLSERNIYYVRHGHTLVGTRLNGVEEENTFVTI